MTKRSAVGYVFTKNLTIYTLLNANDSLNFFLYQLFNKWQSSNKIFITLLRLITLTRYLKNVKIGGISFFVNICRLFNQDSRLPYLFASVYLLYIHRWIHK